MAKKQKNQEQTELSVSFTKDEISLLNKILFLTKTRDTDEAKLVSSMYAKVNKAYSNIDVDQKMLSLFMACNKMLQQYCDEADDDRPQTFYEKLVSFGVNDLVAKPFKSEDDIPAEPDPQNGNRTIYKIVIPGTADVEAVKAFKQKLIDEGYDIRTWNINQANPDRYLIHIYIEY